MLKTYFHPSYMSFPMYSSIAGAREGEETTSARIENKTRRVACTSKAALREASIIRRIWSGSDPSEADVSLPFKQENLMLV